MLRIKRETDYAIRCIYYLSGRKSEVVMVDEISREMHIPKCFLAKILQRLSKAGIVKSFVGVQGGFVLEREPGQISLFNIVTAIEGPVAMNKCTVDKKSCRLRKTCRIHPIWVGVRKDVEEILKKNTFQIIREGMLEEQPGK